MEEDETLPPQVKRLIDRLREVRNATTATTRRADGGESDQRSKDRVLNLTKLRDYAQGEQFRGGDYWRGRKPKGANWAEVVKLYKQNNQITRCLLAIRSGILGKDPEWELRRTTDQTDDKGEPVVATAKTDPELKKLEAAIGDWHGDANVQAILEEAKFVEQWGGSCCIRMYIPEEFTDEEGVNVEAGGMGSFEDALELLIPQVVDPAEGGVIRDDHGRIIGYYYLFKEDEQDRIELHAPERTYILDTQYHVLEREGKERSGPNPRYDEKRRRRPRFMMFELRRRDGPAITGDVIDAQDALNVSGTYQRRNEDMAGFRSLVLMNAKPPPPKDDGTAGAWQLGVDSTLELVGVDLELGDTDYDTGLPNQTARIATPSFDVIEPVDPSYFLKTKADYVNDILDAFDLGHLLAPFLAVSGASKKESRDPYEKRLIMESATVAAALTWIIETALEVAAWLSDDDLKGISCKPRLYLDVSQGSIDLWSALVAGYPDTVSLETLVQVNPAVIDVEAEMERLEKQRAESEKRRKEELAAARRQLEDDPGGDDQDDLRDPRAAA